MAMLGNKFPETQFMITGVLGPGSNAHGPNEFLHIPYGKKLTPEEKYHHEIFKSFCDTYPEMVLRAADPVWGPSFEA